MDDDVIPPGSFKPSHGQGVLTPWRKGIGGNPAGEGSAPPLREARRIAKDSSPAAMLTLVQIMHTSPDDRCRLVAANSILDRAGVRAPKDPDKGGDDRPRLDLSKEIAQLRDVFSAAADRAMTEAAVRDQDDGPNSEGTD